jgi:hypothetical protein
MQGIKRIIVQVSIFWTTLNWPIRAGLRKMYSLISALKPPTRAAGFQQSSGQSGHRLIFLS